MLSSRRAVAAIAAALLAGFVIGGLSISSAQTSFRSPLQAGKVTAAGRNVQATRQDTVTPAASTTGTVVASTTPPPIAFPRPKREAKAAVRRSEGAARARRGMEIGRRKQRRESRPEARREGPPAGFGFGFGFGE